MSFVTEEFALTTTSTLVVAAVDFSREVIVASAIAPAGLDNVRVGFTAADDVQIAPSNIALGSERLRFVLPADEELYARVTSGTSSLQLIVTEIGR